MMDKEGQTQAMDPVNEPDDAAEPEGAAEPDGASEPEGAAEPDDAAEPEGAGEPEDAAEPTVQPGMNWYVLRVASNKEEKVRDTLVRKVKIEGLDEKVGRILVPTLKEKRMKAGVLRISERKLYPGYVFVEMACEDDGAVLDNVWFMVKETTGVGDFIGSDGKPTSMPLHDVEQMLLACAAPEEEPTLAGLKMKKGDLVKVTDGAFESYEGEVDSVDERRGMVTVIVAIFGRSTPVEVGYWQLEKVED